MALGFQLSPQVLKVLNDAVVDDGNVVSGMGVGDGTGGPGAAASGFSFLGGTTSTVAASVPDAAAPAMDMFGGMNMKS